jgi:hypothetical protein
MPGEKIWHYKGLVKPIRGYLGPPCSDAALLVVVKSSNRDSAEILVHAIMARECLSEIQGEFGETTDDPFDSTVEVRRTFEEAIRSGSACWIQPFL